MLEADKWLLILSLMSSNPERPPALVPISEYRSEADCSQGASLTTAALERQPQNGETKFGFRCVPVWSEPIKAVTQ
jgi:hypothetical protein